MPGVPRPPAKLVVRLVARLVARLVGGEDAGANAVTETPDWEVK